MNHYAANSMQNKEDPQSWQHDQGEQLAKLRGARIQVWDQPVYIMWVWARFCLPTVGMFEEIAPREEFVI